MDAASVTGNESGVRGLAVMSLTFACILHALWRKGGIIFNNLLALLTVLLLLALIVIGFVALAGRFLRKYEYEPILLSLT